MNRTAIASLLLPFTAPAARLLPGIRILMYHRVATLGVRDQLAVSPERFERQIAWLAEKRRLVSLEGALDELAAGGPAADGVAVTFDDGYRDNLEHALPVLRRHGVPATIFVAPRFCSQVLRHPRFRDEPGRLHLDWDEVRELARTPGITIGSHTLTHPLLPCLDANEAWSEICDSRCEIEDRLGTAVVLFCYPSGDVTPRESEMVRRAGYAGAVTVAPGRNRAGADPFALRRTEMTDRDEPRELALKLGGAFDPMHRVLHWRRRRAFAAARASSWARRAGMQPP